MTQETRKRCALSLDQLRRVCDPSAIVAGSEVGVIGQAEAMESLDLGLRMNDGDYARQRYNICVVGPSNTGRTTKTLMYLRRYAEGISYLPDDVICLHNQDNPRKPFLAFVPNGQANALKEAITGLRIIATVMLPKLAAEKMEKEATKLFAKRQSLIDAANQVLKGLGMVVVEPEDGQFAFGQLKADGEPLTAEEFQALSEEERRIIETSRAAYKDMLDTLAAQLVKDLNALSKVLRNISKQTLEYSREKLRGYTNAILKVAGGNSVVAEYLDGLIEFLAPIASVGIPDEQAAAKLIQLVNKMTTVNILVSNSGVKHPPVVHATEPQYSRIFGRINGEPGETAGTVHIDHTMVEAGDMLMANGGYLVIDMGQMLKLGGGVSFYKLLQVIRNSRLTIEGKASFLDLGSMVEFRVEDIPVNVRIVVICDRRLAHVLRHVEPDFDNLFRINAEFDSQMTVGEATSAYATFLAMFSSREEILPVSKAAVAKLVEFGSRRVGDRHKASTEFGVIKDVAAEASQWAKVEGVKKVRTRHVKKALDERWRRQTLLVRRYQEHYDNGHILWNTEGTAVGAVNALVVLGSRSDTAFGLVAQVSARAFAGKEKVVLIQRENETSGPISNGAVATIRGWLSGKYGRGKALSLAIQLSFEQNYGGIEGDSATVAEVLATLSAITELPLDQRLVVTGSMNQWGKVQPIGGVNEKLEGHIGLLNRRCVMSEGHGAVIPIQNLDGLMLDDEALEAQASGKYRVYAISDIDEAIEIFFGLPAADVHKLVKKKLAGIGAAKPWFFVRWFLAFLKVFARKEKPPEQNLLPPPPEILPRLMPWDVPDDEPEEDLPEAEPSISEDSKTEPNSDDPAIDLQAVDAGWEELSADDIVDEASEKDDSS